MSVIEHVMSLEQLVTIEEMNLEERGERLADLMAENAKLRELAGRMLSSIRRFEVCSDSYRVSSVYEQWMRELGMEVDG